MRALTWFSLLPPSIHYMCRLSLSLSLSFSLSLSLSIHCCILSPALIYACRIAFPPCQLGRYARKRERERARSDHFLSSHLFDFFFFPFVVYCECAANQAGRQAERLTLCVPYAHIEEGLAGKEKEANRTRSIISPRTENLKKKLGTFQENT